MIKCWLFLCNGLYWFQYDGFLSNPRLVLSYLYESFPHFLFHKQDCSWSWSWLHLLARICVLCPSPANSIALKKESYFFTSCSAQGFPDVGIVSNFASPDSSWLHLGSTCWPAPVLTTGRWIYSSHVAICPVTTHSIFKISKITHTQTFKRFPQNLLRKRGDKTGWSYTRV